MSIDKELKEKEVWIKQTVISSKGVILTKKHITPLEEEEKLNRRETCRLKCMIPLTIPQTNH
ncbi:hypothetical protein YC2023_028363 [Brassica napus]